MLRKMAGVLRARLIPNARAAWRLWSIRLSALGTLVMGTVYAWPDATLLLWNMMPIEVRAYLPDDLAQLTAFSLFAAVIAVRLLKQKEHADDE